MSMTLRGMQPPQAALNPEPRPAYDEWQVSFPMLFGGPSNGGPNSNGVYQIIPPWNGACEMIIIGISTGGSAGGAAYISQALTPSTQSSIATSGLAGNTGTPGIYIDGNVPFQMFGVWFPIDGPLGLYVVGNNNGILVNCIFRRRRSSGQPRRMGEIFQPPAPTSVVTSGPQNHTMPARGNRRGPNGR